MSSAIEKTLVSLTAPASFAAEQYQGLRLKIERLRQSRDVRVLAVSSPGVGDGKTVTSINLAAALGHGSSARVLLIDADLRRPSIGSQLGVQDDEIPGLADAIEDPRLELRKIVGHVEGTPFDVVLSGSSQAPAHELLRSPRLERLLQEARQLYDYVILDTPPLVPVTDSVLLARSVDGVLIVVAANETPRKLLEESLNLLEQAKVLGIVFNRDSRPLYGYYDSYYRTRFPRRSPAFQSPGLTSLKLD